MNTIFPEKFSEFLEPGKFYNISNNTYTFFIETIFKLNIFLAKKEEIGIRYLNAR
jgi:hypothetical protein